MSTPGHRTDTHGADTRPAHPPHAKDLPANAHGKDRVDADESPTMDDGSMYDGRPGEDKDRREGEMP